MKNRKIKETSNDPTLPRTPVVVGGKTYDLCFDLGALAEAETALNRQGHEVNLLAALPQQNLANTRIVFAAALRVFHPEIGFNEAQRLLSVGDIYDVAYAIQQAWKACMPESDGPRRPPEAEAKDGLSGGSTSGPSPVTGSE